MKRPPSASALKRLPCHTCKKNGHCEKSHKSSETLKNSAVFFISSVELAPFFHSSIPSTDFDFAASDRNAPILSIWRTFRALVSCMIMRVKSHFVLLLTTAHPVWQLVTSIFFYSKKRLVKKRFGP